jgi:hypothetical protein
MASLATILTGKPLINLFLYTQPNKIKCTISTLTVTHVFEVLLQKMGKDTEANQVLTCAARCQVRSVGYSSVRTDYQMAYTLLETRCNKIHMLDIYLHTLPQLI